MAKHYQQRHKVHRRERTHRGEALPRGAVHRGEDIRRRTLYTRRKAQEDL